MPAYLDSDFFHKFHRDHYLRHDRYLDDIPTRLQLEEYTVVHLVDSRVTKLSKNVTGYCNLRSEKSVTFVTF